MSRGEGDNLSQIVINYKEHMYYVLSTSHNVDIKIFHYDYIIFSKTTIKCNAFRL